MWLPWRFNGEGYLLCPFCKRLLERLELNEEMGKFLSPHFLCADSGFVFYGDREGLDVCQQVEQDLNSKYEKVGYVNI